MKNKNIYVVFDYDGEIIGIYINKENALNHAWKEFCCYYNDVTDEEIKEWFFDEEDEGKTIKEKFYENMGDDEAIIVVEWRTDD